MENTSTATIAFTPVVSAELSAASSCTQPGGRPFGVTRNRVMTADLVADRHVRKPFYNSIGAATGAAKQGAPPRGVPR